MGDVLTCDPFGVELCDAAAELAPAMGQGRQRPDGLGPARVLHDEVEEAVNIALFDDEAAIHEGLPGLEFRIDQEAHLGAPVGQANGDARLLAAAILAAAALGIDDGESSAADQAVQKKIQDKHGQRPTTHRHRTRPAKTGNRFPGAGPGSAGRAAG